MYKNKWHLYGIHLGFTFIDRVATLILFVIFPTSYEHLIKMRERTTQYKNIEFISELITGLVLAFQLSYSYLPNNVVFGEGYREDFSESFRFSLHHKRNPCKHDFITNESTKSLPEFS